ncbi:MAG: hypothetical protein WC947_03890 [Elusimicrobiota bacterium]
MKKRKILFFFICLAITGCHKGTHKYSSYYEFNQVNNELVKIQHGKPIIFKIGNMYTLSMEFSEPMKEIYAQIGDRNITFIPDETRMKWEAVFMFPSDGSLDNEKFMRFSGKDLADTPLIITESIPDSALNRDENGNFPEIQEG